MTLTTVVVASPPRLCATARSASGSCRVPPSPRSCSVSSTTCAVPVAPMGWPFAFSPPEGIDERGYRVAVVDLGAARVLGRLDGAAEIGDAVALAGHVEDERGYAVPRFEPA